MSEYLYVDHDVQDTTGTRWCFVCLKPVREITKAGILSAGMGLKIVAHPECLENLSDAKTELDERQKRDTLAKSIASEIKAGNIGLIRAMIDTIESEQ